MQVDPPKTFIPGGAKASAVDPRKTTKRDVQIAIPRVSGKIAAAGSLSLIDVIPRRKHENVIRKEIDDIRMRQEMYRPAHTHAVSSEAEKERLNQIFQYKGGKGLPDELTLPAGMAPFEVAERKREQDRIAQVREKRFPTKPAAAAPRLTPAESLEQQIVSEINERREHLESMRDLGALQPTEERRLKGEISQRLNELRRMQEQGREDS